MSKQVQVKLPWNFFRPCICGHPPKVYKTFEGLHDCRQTYHLECFQCKIFTPKLNDLQIAGMVFKYLVDTVRKDRDCKLEFVNGQWR